MEARRRLCGFESEVVALALADEEAVVERRVRGCLFELDMVGDEVKSRCRY